MRSFSESIDVMASPADVFLLWSTPSGWPHWDPDIEAASLDGVFEVGSTGTIKPKAGPQTRIVLTSVQPDKSFVAEARLPLCSMIFEHNLVSIESGCRVTHAVRLAGPLAPVFSWLLGGQLTRGLPGTMAGLKAALESGNHRPAASRKH